MDSPDNGAAYPHPCADPTGQETDAACMHERFEWHARQHPDAIAVVDGALSLTYAMLDKRADLLAARLRAIGIGMEDRVAIRIARSHHFVTAMLGVLKAGAGYVPIDPEDPASRVDHLIAAARPKALLCAGSVPEGLAILPAVVDLVALDQEIPASVAVESVPGKTTGTRLFYVIHTSGSTGIPKGVEVTHQNVCRLFDMLRPHLGFSRADVWSFYHSPAFGYSIWEIWGALSQGGTLVVIPDTSGLSGADFAALLATHGVTVLSLTPSAFRHHLLDGAFAKLPPDGKLRMIALSGEAPVAADLQKWFAAKPRGGPRILSTYAATETGGQVAWKWLTPDDNDPAWLGHVLEDTRIFILDDKLEHVGDGEAGEICVAGPGLARGYLNEPGLTGAAFPCLPSGPLQGTRIYRTGDRGRRRKDGSIGILGRNDDQVKIGGHRIELGEIETALRDHPTVAEAVVVTWPGSDGLPRLVAYVAGANSSGESSRAAVGTGHSEGAPEFWPSIGEYQVYDDVLYHFMTHEPVRTTAYRKALDRHSRGKVVVDIGTGKDALLARFAAEAGARKVYAIEVIPEAATQATRTIASLGLEDRVTVLCGDSNTLDLPEPADVWTQGIIGNIGSSDGIIPIANAARRWLKPDAVAIPSRCVTWIAAVELPRCLRDNPSFGPLAKQYAERVFASKGRRFDIRLCLRNFPVSNLISDRAVFEDLDFGGPIATEASGNHTFRLAKDGRFDGFILWTHVTTCDGVAVDFLENQQAWLPVFFPAGDKGEDLKAGDTIDVAWERRLAANGLNPDYHISTSFSAADGTTKTSSYLSSHDEDSHGGTAIHRQIFRGWQEASPRPADPCGLRAHLAHRLPEYMVPATIMVLDRLPRNTNGKIDKQALPEPSRCRPDLRTSYHAPDNQLEMELIGIWEDVLALDNIGIKDDFFDLGGNSLQAISITSRIQDLLGEHVYVVAIFDAPTVAALANYLGAHYPAAINRLYPDLSPASQPVGQARLTDHDEAVMREAIRPRVPRPSPGKEPAKNPRAVFILSTHRSGSTLFRIMLAGHPELFAPPELELLGFDTLDQRKNEFSGRDSYWLEGTVRALMQLRGCTVDEAEHEIHGMEAAGLPVPEFYRKLQEAAGPRLLVDKSTHYALNADTLQRAEDWFDDPLFIHLLRHPCGSIQSYLDTRMEFFFRHEHAFSTRQLAELNWLISQRNILGFLDRIPAHRQHRIRFEELVADPETVMSGVCGFLGVPMDPAVLDPYGDPGIRMTDPIRPHTMMLGDIKFAGHGKIDPGIATRWQGKIDEASLGDPTIELARKLGYAIDAMDAPPRAEHAIEAVASFAQQRFWFLQQLGESGLAQNVCGYIRMHGHLDIPAMTEAVHTIIARHDSLRTRFASRDGALVISVDPVNRTAAWTTHDFSMMDEPGRQQAVDAVIAAARSRIFDLEHGPLASFDLIQLGRADHILVRCFHHIATDAWSTGCFNRELSLLYRAFRAGDGNPLPPLAFQYADYARWQRAWLGQQVMARQLGYWRTQLEGICPLELPADHPRGTTLESVAAVHQFVIEETRALALESYCRASGITPFMLLLGVFQILMARHSGQSDICIGIPSANRRLPEWEPLIGFFVNTLVVRIRLDDETTFDSLLQEVRRVVVESFDNQDVPFDKLVEELNPDRDLGRNPLVQVMFEVRDDSHRDLDLTGLDVRASALPPLTTHFDLDLSVLRGAGDWHGTIMYNAGMFAADTIQRMAGHFSRLLAAALETPSRPVFELDMLSMREKEDVLALACGPVMDYPRNGSLTAIIDGHARVQPDAPAFHQGGITLSYADLANRSDAMARELQALGARNGSAVVILVRRSVDFPLAVLGGMKSGACVVPVDAGIPGERLAFILADTSASVVVVQRETLALLPHQRACATLVLEEGKCIERIHPPRRVPQHHALLGDAAYVTYTSGSTGQPKGVVIGREALQAHLSSIVPCYGLSSSSRALATASLGFDVAMESLLCPLMVGGMVTMTAEEPWEPDEMTRQLEHHAITFAGMNPAYWQHWLDSLDRATAATRLASLELMDVGADVMPPEAVARFHDLGLSHIRLVNSYGPTEATITAISHDVEAPAYPRIPIGRPLPNRRAYILGKRDQLVPRGVVGELCLGGIGVATAYLNQPELTASKFVVDPFVGHPDARMYRSGDMVRHLPDGTIDFLGRSDNQVKIRGHRIELGEIDCQLRAIPEIADAATVVAGATPAARRLVAYLVVRENQDFDPAAIRGILAARLPGYMVPSAFVRVDALPMTSSGKVDRRKLAAMIPAGVSESAAFGTPVDKWTIRALDVFRAVLGRGDIGAEDDFFHVGGHSLLAMKVLHLLKETHGLVLPVRVLFEAPTADALGRRLAEAKARAHMGGVKISRHLVSLRQGAGENDPIVVMPGSWSGDDDLLHFAEILENHEGDRRVIGVHMRLGDSRYPFPDRIEDRAKRLAKEIAGVIGSRNITIIAEDIACPIAVELARQLLSAPSMVPRLILLNPGVAEDKGLMELMPAEVRRYRKIARNHLPARLELPAEILWSEGDSLAPANKRRWINVFSHVETCRVDPAVPHGLPGFAVVARAFAMAGLPEKPSVGTIDPPSAHRHQRHFVSLRQGDQSLRPLVILPGGDSGSAELLVFARLARHLPGQQPVFGMDLRLGNSRYPLPDTLAGVAANLLDELSAIAGGLGFDLAGECHAGPLACEIARQAAAGGHEVGKLILLDSICPADASIWKRMLKVVTGGGSEPSQETPDKFLARQRQRYFSMLGNHRFQLLARSVELICCADWNDRYPGAMGWEKSFVTWQRHVVEGNHHTYIRDHAAGVAGCLGGIIAIP